MSDALDTHGYRIKKGKHHGELITRVPVPYLQWMVRERHEEAAYAQAELARRGVKQPEVEISAHAVDRASTECLKQWRRTRQPGEGIHAWLARMSVEAIKKGKARGEKIAYEGMLFAFEAEGVWPLLKTIMKDNRPTPKPRERFVGDDEEDLLMGEA